ncbi:MAG TPA: chromosome segregation protein SMC [Tepidiformaceae bacterium]|nr:chromosome segregation protein SMC [Tepidiformaceae bacterium]
MYLKKLSIQGFKSFANRTSFEYGPGITAVVGPNGSGKSNVSDALRWVLGEQSARLLRAKKQEDVIFAGTKDRPAVGMAEVVLTLDNSERWLPLEFAEVEIARRSYRSGESEYLLNGSRVRLRDITDLLMKGDVGQNSYSIMGQGLVDEVLSMSPEERRAFLDEAADVKRFRMRIKEAQDRLAATRDNIGRVQLIVAEIEPRLSQLSRQAERAAEYRRLSAELNDLLRAYYGHRWSEAHNHLIRARAELDQRVAEEAGATDRVTALREQLRALGEEIRKRREAITRRDSRVTEIDTRLAATEQNISLDRERHGMIAGRRQELLTEAETLESERESLAATEIDAGDRGSALQEQMEAARAFMDEARAGLDSAERAYSSARAKAREAGEGAADEERRAGSMSRDAEAASRRLEQLDREEQQTIARRKQITVELIGYGRRFADLRRRVFDAEDGLEGARADADAARERLARVQDEVRAYESAAQKELRELDQLEGRMEALKQVQAEHDGVASGTRNVLIMGHALLDEVDRASLGEAPEIHGVVGLLSRQIRVPAGAELAINAARQKRLHAVHVESEEHALAAIERLTRRRAGRAQFLALDTVRHVYPLNLQKERGVVGVAAKLVRCEQRFRPLIDTLLGRVIVVEDVQTGLRMVRRALGSVVTLDGTYIEPTGVITGGASSADEGVFSRQRELDELPEQIAAVRAKADVSKHQIETARQAVTQLSARARDADQRYETIRRNLDGARSDMERERGKLHRLRRDMDSVKARRADIARERDQKERLIAQARQAVEAVTARGEERRRALAASEEELRAATAEREAALRAAAEASGRQAAAEGERRALQAMREQHEKSLERIAAQVVARRAQAASLEQEASAIEGRLARLEGELARIHEERARFTEDAAPDRDELTRLESHERLRQEEFNEAQTALLALNRSRLDLEADVARAEDQIHNLRAEMEREGLTPDRSGAIIRIEDAVEEEPGVAVHGGAAIDVEATRARIDEIRRQVRRLGPINAEAPDDYRENRERHEFLTTQLRDLADAEAQLRAAIEELSGEIRIRFSATFEKVAAAFSEYFTAFFGGGSAQLTLTNPDDFATTGIEIEAQPPGKRIKTLSLLSGGERSLTAVALLFALLTANPAPFVVLDEVDAALDEANVGRFTAALKKLAERTQFLVVTHNRRTVEVADAIYGVSMGRDGVSKVLSLKLGDVPQN